MSTTTTTDPITSLISNVVNGFLMLLGFQITKEGIKPPDLNTLIVRSVGLLIIVLIIVFIVKLLMKII